MEHIFFEFEFIMLVMTSVLLPSGIYAYLMFKQAISRWTVLGLAVLLIALSGIDVFFLQLLGEQAKSTPSLLDDQLFTTQLSVALYILPAVFAGIGVNLVSHILISHLNEAERRFERQHEHRKQSGGPA